MFVLLCVFLVQFIDFTRGADSGYIRFEEPEAAQKARAAGALAQEGGLVVKNYIAALDPVTGMQHFVAPFSFHLNICKSLPLLHDKF